MQTIKIYAFHNYDDRRFIPASQLSDHVELSAPGWQVMNFNYGDGVNTTQVVGTKEVPFSSMANYLVCTENLKSTYWFIIRSEYLRGNEFRLTLRRDVLQEIGLTTFLVKRGYVDYRNDLIFNAEGMTFDKILTERAEITDRTLSPWYVAYLSKDFTNGGNQTISFDTVTSDADITLNYLSEWEYYDNINTPVKFVDAIDLEYKIGWIYIRGENTLYSTAWCGARVAQYSTSQIALHDSQAAPNVPSEIKNPLMAGSSVIVDRVSAANEYFAKNCVSGAYASMMNALKQGMTYGAYFDSSDRSYQMQMLDGKTLYDINANKYYRIKVTTGSSGVFRIGASPYATYTSPMQTIMNSALTTMRAQGYWSNVQPSSSAKWYDWQLATIRYTPKTITLTEIAAVTESDSITITTNHAKTNDAPYDVLCFPARDVVTFYKNNSQFCTTSEKKAQALASALCALPTTQVYDVQLLPFAPIEAAKLGYPRNGCVRCDDLSENVHYFTNSAKTLLAYISSSSVYKDTTLLCDMEKGRSTTKLLSVTGGYKRSSECDMWRLCSPNMATAWDFNAAKMDGFGTFTMGMECKPNTPFVQVVPSFERLYGKRYDDTRGLICSGEFSLSRTSSEWNEYELRNKNYQLQFNREIENLSLSQNVEREQQKWSIAAGVVSSAFGGASSAGLSFGGVGAGIAGGLMMGGLSAAGGIRDYQISEKLRNEAQSFKKDMFSMSIENIQAVPRSLTNVSPRNPRNKGCVMIEYYTASDEQINAFLDYIQWYGMTINRVSRTLDAYAKDGEEVFIQARLIRTLWSFDATFYDAINEELERGIYYRKGDMFLWE